MPTTGSSTKIPAPSAYLTAYLTFSFATASWFVFPETLVQKFATHFFTKLKS
jgi:hypothetical protein